MLESSNISIRTQMSLSDPVGSFSKLTDEANTEPHEKVRSKHGERSRLRHHGDRAGQRGREVGRYGGRRLEAEGEGQDTGDIGNFDCAEAEKAKGDEEDDAFSIVAVE